MRRILRSALPLAAEVILTSGCSSPDQRMARAALKGSLLQECLGKAHWIAATRSGAMTFDPDSVGTGFIDFQEKDDLERYLYAVELVGPAKSLLSHGATAFLPDYKKAGSPVAASNGSGQERVAGRRLLSVDDRSGSWSIRGEAKGWLSRERNLYCATDSLNGRYFIVSRFTPAFRVNGS